MINVIRGRGALGDRQDAPRSSPSGHTLPQDWGMAKAPHGYNSLFDTKPAGSNVKLVPPVDLQKYDLEATNALMDRSKELAAAGKKTIEQSFPDPYHGEDTVPFPQAGWTQIFVRQWRGR